MRFALDDLVSVTGGRLVPGVAHGPSGMGGAGAGGAAGSAAGGAGDGTAGGVEGAGIDSRAIGAGSLFVAVVAERDGHDFVASAEAAGAAAALVSRPVERISIPQVVVVDTVAALAALGRAARARIDGPVVGITGSVGKTSTKDLLAAVCGRAGVTTASARSLNNEMGVPLTLVNADPATERTIVEMGARGIGHIADLCAIARPTVGIVTAVAAAHTELFGTVDDVAIAKGELIEALADDGVAVLNADDPRVATMASRATARVVTFGSHGDVRAERIEIDDDLRAHFVLHAPEGSADVHLGVRGGHNVSNALAAAAAALATGVSLADVSLGLGDAELSPSRMHLTRLASGGIVLDDAYNANPASMRAALDGLARLDVERRIAVLGVMAELGPDGPAEHRAIAELAHELDVEVFAVGTDLYGTRPYADVDALIAALDAPGVGEAVLLKGSRVAGLDRVARRWIHEGPPPR